MVVSYASAVGFILPTCGVGLLWALFNWYSVTRHKVQPGSLMKNQTTFDGQDQDDKTAALIRISQKISEGADAFIHEEYFYAGIFICIMTVGLIFVVSGYCAIAFFIGAVTSMLCGYIGMKVATGANYRTAQQAMTSLGAAYQLAYSAGCVMGFSLVSISLMILTIIIMIFYPIHVSANNQGTPEERQQYFNQIEEIFDYIAGYGLGGSTVALFARVGGGIYTKAADVGADLVGKVEHDLKEDSPQNPATIADNVGDNVGDIAGMGADLFGSFAESTCAALVVSASQLKYNLSDSDDLFTTSINTLFYPLLLSAVGILICLLTSFIGIYVTKVSKPTQIESTLKLQLLISSVLLTPALIGMAYWAFPDTFYMTNLPFFITGMDEKHPWHAYVCSIMGLYAGLIIGYFTEYMTSHAYSPVRQVADACKTGAATNIIYGLALGYMSTIIPVACIAVTAFISLKLLSYYGVALAALGMLSNLCIGLAIDAYGPISDNAGGIAEMAELGDHIRERTDALDAAGNTTAAIGKGFAIGSAALVSLSLYGGFITRVQKDGFQNADILDPMIFGGLLIGAMLPYVFTAMTMKSVGKAAMEMVVEVRRQLRENPGIKTGEVEPDYKACVQISTRASLKEMVAPGMLVILSPIIVGVVFGPKGIAGLLPGALVSGIQLAISSANSGGAWDNAKKFIEQGGLGDARKGSDEHKAAVVGDTVGDPLKDTSGPALNILIKLMAILSLVLASFFSKHYLVK